MSEKEKPRTTDEYVLEELERQKRLNRLLTKKNEDLQAELDKKVPIPDEPTITESPYKCYGYSVLSSYSSDWDKLIKPLTADEIQELLDDDTRFRAWAVTATYKDYCGTSRVFNIIEFGYNFEINYFGTLIGIKIDRYSDGTVNVNDFIIDNKRYSQDYDLLKEKALKTLKENLTYRCKELRKKEAAEAAKLAESEQEPQTEEK